MQEVAPKDPKYFIVSCVKLIFSVVGALATRLTVEQLLDKENDVLFDWP